MAHTVRSLLLVLALLLAGAVGAFAEYWELPETLAEGQYPAFFSSKAGPIAIWQDSQATGADSGRAWIRSARFDGAAWRKADVSPASYSYNSTGSPPILFSACQSASGEIAVAIAASGTRIELRVSRDGGASFEAAGSLESATTSVAPRIFPSASGGWILFATQGRQSTMPGAEGGAAEAVPSSISIYVARSADGRSWSPFESLVSDDEKLLINFAPTSVPFGGKDIVVFQTFILGEGDLSSRYALLSTTSTDGGATWSAAKPVTDFMDPSGGATASWQNYDNQGPQLTLSGGKLYLAWERRKAKTTQTQVWASRMEESGSLDLKSAGPVASVAGSSFMLSQIFDDGGSPSVLAREDKLKSNRILLARLKDGKWESDDADLAGQSDRYGAGLVAFARGLRYGGRSFIAWQFDAESKSRILVLRPDTSAAPASLVPLNFTLGKRSRAEEASVRVDLPADPSGIKEYTYIWKKTPDKADAKALAALAPSLDELWKSGTTKEPSSVSLSLPATQDGAWTLWLSVADRAGNRSAERSISYYRKRIPPDPPILLAPETDASGFLLSNSFTLRWLPPEAEDLAGYTWDFAYAGPLESAIPVSASASASAAAARPGLSSYESVLLASLGARVPPAGVLGTDSYYSTVNVDNGYYVLSVAAIDTTGNVSGASSILVKADKYKPYTVVTLVESARDDLGRTSLRIRGKGFLAEGNVERVVLDRNGREPYDIDRNLAEGGFRVASDREIADLRFEDIEAGVYRIGVYHSTRGWYWSAPILAVDASGTIKYGLAASYQPSLRLFSGPVRPFTIYDAIVLIAVLFAAVGILLSSRQVVAVVREGEQVRREAYALVTGGPMPQVQKGKAARSIKRRHFGLRVKFTLTIAALVILVVLLLAISLGYNMIIRTNSDLATGLDQRARVLLESVAQGGRFFIGKEDAVTQLSLFPSQARAMEGATYITITGEGADPKVASGELVYATNDPKIVEKLDPATLGPDRNLILGKSAFQAQGGKDLLAPLVAQKAAQLREKARAAIADELELKVRLGQEKAGLKAGKDSDQRRSEINTELDAVDVRIRDKLRVLSDQEVGSVPGFDPASLAGRSESYLYYKPILEYRPSDSLLYRGMVRLEVSTRQIATEVAATTRALIRLTLIIAAIALAAGIVGAFILSTVIVVPIRKLVAQIERIRDTEDKESLEGSKIEVASHDELFTLAETVNQMTEGLVHAAKASKDLIIGKGIQKMFIPLDNAPGSKTKISTGRRDEKDFEVFGYYEGADAVSGDYWDFRPINARYHYFIKCDVSGHGVPAALIMVQVATMVINYFNEWKKAMPKAIDLTDLAYKINDFLEERQFVGKFAAFTLGVWDSQAGVAYLCEAGDRNLHVWDESEGKLVVEQLPDSPAAGPLASILIQMKQPFAQVTRKLDKDDILFLYTDGIEEAKHYFRDAEYKVVPCQDAPKDERHDNHSGGEDNEEFGYERLTAILEAVASRGSYTLTRHHDPAQAVFTFDFSTCEGSLEEKIIALVSIEKVNRFYRDPTTTAKDSVLVDQKVDAFLERHFDQYRLYCADKRPNEDPENPGYVFYNNLKEDAQWDDLTFLVIRRK